MAETGFSYLDKIRITVVEAQDLAPKDRNGRADPYIIVGLRKKEHKTKIMDSTLNPVWNKEDATFMMEVSEDDLNDHDSQLKFTVWNKNRASRDDYMGEAAIPLQQLLDAAEAIQTIPKTIDQWMRLESEGKKSLVTGSIHIFLEIIFSSLDENEGGVNNSKIRVRLFRHFPTISTSETILYMYRCTLSGKKIGQKGRIIRLGQLSMFLFQCSRNKEEGCHTVCRNSEHREEISGRSGNHPKRHWKKTFF